MGPCPTNRRSSMGTMGSRIDWPQESDKEDGCSGPLRSCRTGAKRGVVSDRGMATLFNDPDEQGGSGCIG